MAAKSSNSAMARLPAWDDNTERGNARMLAWLDNKLDAQFESLLADDPQFEHAWDQLAEGVEKGIKRQMSIVAEQQRLIGLLEVSGLFPSTVLAPLRDYVEGRTRSKGRRGRPAKSKTERRENASYVWMAAADVPRIRALWREYYGRHSRTRSQASAEDFAAERWGVDAGSVKNMLRRSRVDPRRLDVD